MSGICIGAYTVLNAVYVSEISPKGEDSKNWSICVPILFNFGVVLAQVLGLQEIFGSYYQWHYCIGFPCIVAMSGILAGSYGCESPAYRVRKRKKFFR